MKRKTSRRSRSRTGPASSRVTPDPVRTGTPEQPVKSPAQDSMVTPTAPRRKSKSHLTLGGHLTPGGNQNDDPETQKKLSRSDLRISIYKHSRLNIAYLTLTPNIQLKLTNPLFNYQSSKTT